MRKSFMTFARSTYSKTVESRWNTAITLLLVILLLLKFFSPLLRFSVPLGYDPGIYRYLFLQYSEVHNYLSIPSLPPWMKEHSIGLFLLTAPLIKLGVPVDWLIGWLWSIFSVVLACTVAYAGAKEWNVRTGITVLFILLMSEGYYVGFAFMFWKTYAALLFCSLSFFFFSRNLSFAIVFSLMTVITHNQTGLLFGCTLMTWAIGNGVHAIRYPHEHDPAFLQKIFFAGSIILVVGAVAYVPIWESAVMRPFHLFLQGWNAPGGTFPLSSSYIGRNGMLLLLGAIGFVMTLRRSGRWTLWHFAALWSAFFVCSHLFFTRDL